MLSILAASAVYRYLPRREMISSRLHEVLAAAAASIVFVIVNHLLLDESCTWLAVTVSASSESSLRSTTRPTSCSSRSESLSPSLALQPGARSLHACAADVDPAVAVGARTGAEVRVDPKTGLYNARYFGAVFAEVLERSRRRHRPLALMMVDLDLLREVNNTYGHLAGDGVIRGVAEVFRAHLRIEDVPARFGGEEFSVLLPETSIDAALEIAERIRREVAERLFQVETVPEPIRATVSIGVSSFPADGMTQTDLIHHADLAVYRAKLQGRNRVVAASTELGF